MSPLVDNMDGGEGATATGLEEKVSTISISTQLLLNSEGDSMTANELLLDAGQLYVSNIYGC
jgi:hypothetical protein